MTLPAHSIHCVTSSFLFVPTVMGPRGRSNHQAGWPWVCSSLFLTGPSPSFSRSARFASLPILSLVYSYLPTLSPNPYCYRAFPAVPFWKSFLAMPGRSVERPRSALDGDRTSYGQDRGTVSLDGSNPWGLPQDTMKDLVGRVQSYLLSHSRVSRKTSQFATGGQSQTSQSGRLERAVRRVATAPGGGHGSSSQTADDMLLDVAKEEATTVISMVVEATIMQLRKDARLGNRAAPSPSPRKPSALTKATLGQTLKAAAPATTLSRPLVSFASHLTPSDRSRSRSPVASTSPGITTLVSSGAITEITWLTPPSLPLASPVAPIIHFEDEPRWFSAGSPLSMTSESPSGHSPSSPVSAPELESPSFRPPEGWHGRSEPATAAPSPRRKRRGQPMPRPDLNPVQHITSFPALARRHGSNDWIVPPTDITKDGEVVRGPAEADPRRTRIYSTVPSASRHASMPADLHRRRSRLPSNVGASLGLSSGRRRSCRPSDEDNLSSLSLLAKIRKGSLQLGQAISSAVVGEKNDAARKESSADRMRAILEQYPKPPRPDRVGIFEAMTGANARYRC